MFIQNNQTILFQGDSITDAGRNRDNPADLGWGYAAQTAAWFSALYPEKNVSFLNRGIGGNRVKDLRQRWIADCLELKPDWVSILIGINDTWRRYDSDDLTSAGAYETDYRFILETLSRELPNTCLIICEPFVLPVPQDRREWRVDLDPKIAVARQMAMEFGAVYIPLDGLFAAAATQREPAFWAGDGVHPSQAGHALIAQSWLRAVKAL